MKKTVLLSGFMLMIALNRCYTNDLKIDTLQEGDFLNELTREEIHIAQLRGIPSKLLIYPDENHWVTKPQNSILWQREFFGWLDKWLKP